MTAVSVDIPKFLKTKKLANADTLNMPDALAEFAKEIIYSKNVIWECDAKKFPYRQAIYDLYKGDTPVNPDLLYTSFTTTLDNVRKIEVVFTPDGNIQGKSSDLDFDIFENPDGIFKEERPSHHNDDYYVAVVDHFPETHNSIAKKVIRGEEACRCFVKLLKDQSFVVE